MTAIEPVYKVIDDTEGMHSTLAVYRTKEGANASSAARQALDTMYDGRYFFVEPAVPGRFDSVLETFTGLDNE